MKPLHGHCWPWEKCQHLQDNDMLERKALRTTCHRYHKHNGPEKRLSANYLLQFGTGQLWR